MTKKRYYPVYLDLTSRPCLVVGGGLIAQRKIASFMDAGAVVTIVSPSVTRRIQRWADKKKIRHIARAFRASDMRGMWLVCAATDDAPVNASVFAQASRRRVFANVVDKPALCSFIAPAIVRRGAVTIAISTGGQSPALAKKLRKDLGGAVGPEYGAMLRLIRGLRPLAKQQLPTHQKRKAYFDALLEGPVFNLMRAGQSQQARREARRLLATRAGIHRRSLS